MSERVALAMIAKDKEHIIERVLDSTEGVFDVYVLQDTGSTDSTVDKFINWCKRNNKEYKTGQGRLATNKDKLLEEVHSETLEDGNTLKTVNFRRYEPGVYPNVVVNGQKILGDFGAARNDSFNLIPADVKWAFWIDTDDILYNPRGIKQLVQICNKNDLDGVIMPYEYAKLTDGIKAVDQQRERLINLKKKGVWKNRVHENYKFEEPVRMAFIKDLGVDVKVIHERSGEDALETNRRNHLIMQAQLDEEGLDKVDEEFVGHMAFDHWEHKEFEKSLALYEELIKRIHSRQHHPDELFQVYLRVARACYEMGNIDAAIANGLKTITVGSNYPDGYLLLAEIYASQGHWDQALFNVEKVISMPRPNTTAPISDIDYLITPRHIKLQAYVQMNRLPEALKVMEELISIMPSNSQFLQEYNRLGAEIKSQNAIRAIGELANYFQEHNMGKNLDKILDVIPLDLRDNPVLRQKIKEIKHDFKRKNTKIRFNGSKSIVFFAGPHFEPWDGRSDIEKGIGGSEGMCIQMARELAKLGNKVFVYNECGESDEKDIDGVVYRNYQKWDADAECDIFVSLRAPQIFGRLIKAKKQFLWLHDTGYGQQKLVDMYAPDKIFVLSDYHQDVIKLNHFINDDSIFHKTRNALNKFAVEYADTNAGERNPYQVIYASSYDRGLDNVLNSWAKVKEAVPEAVLKIYYGWNTYDGMMNMRAQQDPRIGQQMAMYKSKIIEQISKLPDVYELGRITQNELYKVNKESGVWYYPTAFTEISCASGDTKILMPRDHKKYPEGVPIKELVGKSNFRVYSYDLENDKIVLGKVLWVAKTGTNRELYKITLDDGTEMKFTPDHKFMMRDGEYKRVDKLKEGDSLMPCYEKPTFAIKQPNGRWEDEHRMVAKTLLGDIEGKVVDHIDNNRFNNNPDNLQILSSSEHATKTFVKDRYFSERSRKRMSEAQIKLAKTPERKEFLSKLGKNRSKKFWDKYKNEWTEEQRKEWAMNRVKNLDYNELSKTMKMKWKNQFAESKYYNHKIAKIEILEEKEDVYDMEVEKYHNFAADGVFVHNCITAMTAQAMGAFPVCTPVAALNETVNPKFGIKVNHDKVADALIYRLKNQDEALRNKMMKWARKEFDVESLAKEWDLFFNEN